MQDYLKSGFKKKHYKKKNASWIQTILNFFLPICRQTGLPAFSGEGSHSSGSERRSHRRGPEQERCCDQGKKLIKSFVLILGVSVIPNESAECFNFNKSAYHGLNFVKQ